MGTSIFCRRDRVNSSLRSILPKEHRMNTVTVLVEGYIKAIEGRQLIPGISADGARHVAGTIGLIRGDNVIIVADPGMVADQALIVDALAKEGIAPHEVTHVFVSHHHP